MRGGWVGNKALQAAVRDGTAKLIPEIVEVVDSHVKLTDAQWDAGTATGSVVNALRGGLTITASSTGAVTQSSDDSTEVTGLSQTTPFDVLIVEWLGAGSADREIESVVARLDPRADGGAAKTVDRFVCQLYRVVEGGNPGSDTTVVPISAPKSVDATGEVAADFTFVFRLTGGGAPKVGQPPVGGGNPVTMVRIWALQDDGSAADNVAWLADSGITTHTNASTYSVTHHTADYFVGGGANGGSVYELSTVVANMPRFTINRASYSAASVEFTSAAAVPDLSGSGPLVIVARGSLPNDSSLTFEIDDGGGYVECVDGDIIGADNTSTGGSDLSGVSTTGPWDINVDLTPSTDTFSGPTVIEFGVERTNSTFLRNAAEFSGGSRKVNIPSLKASIPRAQLRILKTGEKDFLDYGSALLSRNHTGQVAVRAWIGDPTEVHVQRKDWMLHSAWDIDDYTNGSSAHILELLSPVRRLRFPIPKFTPTSGNDGTRDPVQFTDDIAAIYEDLLDTHGELPARLIGQGCTDATTQIAKRVQESDLKDEVDAVAYLEGRAVIESQGRIKAVQVMRDAGGADTPIAYYPLGSYDPTMIGPGFTARTDETFVRYNYNESEERFEDERRYLNATALGKLGGVGLNTTHRIPEQVVRWVTTEALADDLGRRVVDHLFSGLIEWTLAPIYRNPGLELGDVVSATTDQFVGRNPITDEEIRGPLSVNAIVTRVGDFWGKDIDVWVPGYEYIVVGEGTTTMNIGDLPDIKIVNHRIRAIGAESTNGDQEFERDIMFQPNATCKSVEVEFGFVRPHKAADQPPASTTFDIDYDVAVTGVNVVEHTLQDGLGAAFVFLSQDNAGTTIRDSSFVATLTPYSATGGAGGSGLAGVARQVTVDKLGDSDTPGFLFVDQSGQEMIARRIVAVSSADFSWNGTTGELELV